MVKAKKNKKRGADIETLGRNFIVGELLRAGLNCAVPVWDTGIDVIAWTEGSATFVPLQLKTTLGQRFGIWKKYKDTNAVIVWVWYVGDPRLTAAYALTYNESVALLKPLGWDKRRGWTERGGIGWPLRDSQVDLLAPYRMTPARWRALVEKWPKKTR